MTSGIICLIIAAILTYVFYFTGGNVEINGTMISQVEFNTLLLPKIILGIFWVIGIVLIIISARRSKDEKKRKAQVFSQNRPIRLLLLGIFITIGELIFLIIYNNMLTTINRNLISEFYVLLIAAIGFLIVVFIIGIFLIINNARKVYDNHMTSLHGEIYYGKIIRIYEKNNIVFNHETEYIADLIICNPLYNYTELVSERIGASSHLFTVGSYYILKYFNNDINILEEINRNNVPKKVLSLLDKMSR